jgi:hypothetical protein
VKIKELVKKPLLLTAEGYSVSTFRGKNRKIHLSMPQVRFEHIVERQPRAMCILGYTTMGISQSLKLTVGSEVQF